VFSVVLYVLRSFGCGSFIRQQVHQLPSPSEWCYLCNSARYYAVFVALSCILVNWVT